MDERGPAGPVAVRAWKPPVPGVREVLHATFAEHAYPPHTHDVWTLFLVDEGAVRYDLDRTERTAERSMVSRPPAARRPRRPARDERRLPEARHLPRDRRPRRAPGRPRGRPPVPARPIAPRPRRRPPRRRSAVPTTPSRRRSGSSTSPSASAVRDGGGHARSRGRRPAAPRPRRGPPRLPRRPAVRDRPRWRRPPSTSGPARPSSPARSRTRSRSRPTPTSTGGAWRSARARILDGHPLADVAAEVGFVDQAHLTRRFKRFLGTTPGQFGHGARSRTDRVPAG